MIAVVMATTATGLLLWPEPSPRALGPSSFDVGGGGSWFRRLVAWAGRRRRAARIAASIPTELDQLARWVGSGRTLRSGLESAVDPAGAFGGLAAALGRGASLEQAVRRWAVGINTEVGRLAAAVLTLGHEGGAGQGAALSSLAEALRGQHQATLDAKALASQARASAVILAALPFVVAAVVALGDPSSWAYYRSPAGAAVTVVGLALNGAGLAWMRVIARRSAR